MSQVGQVLYVAVAYECAAVRLMKLVTGSEVVELPNARRSEAYITAQVPCAVISSMHILTFECIVWGPSRRPLTMMSWERCL